LWILHLLPFFCFFAMSHLLTFLDEAGKARVSALRVLFSLVVGHDVATLVLQYDNSWCVRPYEIGESLSSTLHADEVLCFPLTRAFIFSSLYSSTLQLCDADAKPLSYLPLQIMDKHWLVPPTLTTWRYCDVCGTLTSELCPACHKQPLCSVECSARSGAYTVPGDLHSGCSKERGGYDPNIHLLVSCSALPETVAMEVPSRDRLEQHKPVFSLEISQKHKAVFSLEISQLRSPPYRMSLMMLCYKLDLHATGYYAAPEMLRICSESLIHPSLRWVEWKG
jgi:hypothetical protein